MSRGRELELPFVSKAPFANYDLVVYFGGGLFATLIFWKYIALPLQIFDFSTVTSSAPHSWVQDVIYLLILAVCAYVLGHLVSYQSSYFIEGFIERTLGKFSSIVELTMIDRAQRSATLKTRILDNTKKNLFVGIRIPLTRLNITLPQIFPTIVHLPVLPWYGIVLVGNFFEFADTRLPTRMVHHLKKNMARCFPEVGDEDGRQWFRWVEYYTAYNRPVAAASMYNYLVISGFMRSLSYLFLIAIWLELMHLGIRLYSHHTLISHGHGGVLGWALYFAVLYTAYVTTVTSYCKFFRRSEIDWPSLSIDTRLNCGPVSSRNPAGANKRKRHLEKAMRDHDGWIDVVVVDGVAGEGVDKATPWQPKERKGLRWRVLDFEPVAGHFKARAVPIDPLGEAKP